jgi:hypothetical protein
MQGIMLIDQSVVGDQDDADADPTPTRSLPDTCL